jgi:competence protein ComEA
MLLPLLALVALIIIGRRTTSAAAEAEAAANVPSGADSVPIAHGGHGGLPDPPPTLAPPHAVAAPARDPSAFAPGGGDVPSSMPPPVDGGASGVDARLAVETLADGGVVVDLNLATENDLRRLPGIGAGRARKILELRAKLGRFRTVEDLARIKGIGRAMIRRLRPYARV